MINSIINGDSLHVLKTIPNEYVNCCITSPPYWGLRDYGVEGQLGLEKTPGEYVNEMVEVFREVKRILKKDGTLWLNLGDSYAGNCSRVSSGRAGYGEEREGIFTRGGDGLKPKDLCGIPWRVTFALQEDGWYLRQDIIWHKPNPMPESVTDRCTKSHEYIFLLAKSQKYYFDNEAIKEKASPDETIRDRDTTKLNNTPGRTRMAGLKVNNYEMRNKRSVWTVSTRPFKEAHFATFPEELIKPCVLAGCPEEGIILDPFSGAGTTALVSKKFNRKYIGIELNPEYIKIAEARIKSILL
jgi:DNA modification methylase